MLYFFVLGSTWKLSLAELQAKYTLQNLHLIASDIVSYQTKNVFHPQNVLQNLGGTVKISQVEKIIYQKKDLVEDISQILTQTTAKKKIIFGISRYANAPIGSLKALSKLVKQHLEKSGFTVRFVLPSENEYLTSVQIVKQKITEIILVKNKEQIFLARTVAVQDFEEWGKRDYKRPFADPKSGMLPPKIARIMINLALQNDRQLTTNTHGPIILDPFCGMGTIGAEALLSGCWVILSDLDKTAVDKANKNLNWLCKNYGIKSDNFSVYNTDSRIISSTVLPLSVDAIVTEPYLGPPVSLYKGRPSVGGKYLTDGLILSVFNQLEKLYCECFFDWKKLLKPQGKVVIIFPSFRVGNNEYFMKNLIDSCEKLGYNVQAGPYSYGHPQSIIRRNIYIFQKR